MEVIMILFGRRLSLEELNIWIKKNHDKNQSIITEDIRLFKSEMNMKIIDLHKVILNDIM
jgi:hypothetical protein